MILHKNLKNVLVVGSVLFLLSACSTAVFPEIIEEDDLSLADVMKKQGKPENIKSAKVIKEGETLGSDERQVTYTDSEEDDIFAGVIDDEEETVLADKAKSAKRSVQKSEKKEPDMIKIPAKKAPVKKAKLSEEIIAETLVEDNEPSVSYRLETIYFDNGSSVVDAQYMSKIRATVKEAKSKNAKIKVAGFASSRTRNTDIVSHKLANFKVSLARAQSVADALKGAGMKDKDILIEAMSDMAPVYQEVMPEGERLNRRAEIYIAY